MTAHDVRHLTLCASCGGLGDRRQMLKIGLHRSLAMGHHHDACATKALSEDEVLDLPLSERNKIRMSAASKSLMRKLLEAA